MNISKRQLALWGLLLACSSCAGNVLDVEASQAELAALTFCPSTGVTSCTTNADCTGTNQFCTRSWNQNIEYAVGTGFGHCVYTDGTVDASAAIQADLCALPLPGEHSTGVPYSLPPASTIRLGDHDGDGVALHVWRRLILEGNGSVVMLDAAADPDLVGIRVRVGIDPAEELELPQYHSNWSSIRDLTVRPVSLAQNGMTGMLLNAHGIRVDNVRAMNLGIAIHIFGPENVYNTNHTRLTNVVFSGNYQHALYNHGGDSNAGLFAGVEVLGGEGIFDSAALMTTWVGSSAEGTTGNSFTFDGSAAVTAVGLYLEEGDPLPVVDNTISSLFVGGNIIRALGPRVDRVGLGRSRLVFQHNPYPGGSAFQTIIPGAVDNNTLNGAIFVQDRGAGESHGWRLRTLGGRWGWYPEGGFTAPFTWQAHGQPNPGEWQLSLNSAETDCSDGIDNDRDGDIDADDSDC